MIDHVARLADRLLAVDWAGTDDRPRSRVALMREYLRRSAFWADHLGSTAWPFADVAAELAPAVRADAAVGHRVEHELAARGVDGLVRTTPAAALRFAALRDAGHPLPDLPDPFEPLVLMFERGGGFTAEGAGVVRGRVQDHLDDRPRTGLDGAALDALDAGAAVAEPTGPTEVRYYGLLHRAREPIRGALRRRTAAGGTVDEIFTRALVWAPAQYFVRYRLGHNDTDHVEISAADAAAFVRAVRSRAARLTREQATAKLAVFLRAHFGARLDDPEDPIVAPADRVTEHDNAFSFAVNTVLHFATGDHRDGIFPVAAIVPVDGAPVHWAPSMPATVTYVDEVAHGRRPWALSGAAETGDVRYFGVWAPGRSWQDSRRVVRHRVVGPGVLADVWARNLEWEPTTRAADPGAELTEGQATSVMGRIRMRITRAAGCLLAGAVGDALGGPVEFLSLAEIRQRYGPGGTTGYDMAYGRRGAITDDTQMTLFTAEALAGSTPAGRTDALHAAYLRWLRTQEDAGPSGPGLLAVPELHSRRAPGTTCLSALHAARHGARGTATDPINDSKGCGGVMRAAPAGLVADDPREAFELGCELAALTHGHPSGYLSAGVLAAAVHLLGRDASLPDALDTALDECRRHRAHEETVEAVRAARALAARGRPRPEDLETLGGAWTGEEALAIAVCAALTATDIADGLLLAVNHSGDSDSTGSLCGNLLGAMTGTIGIPRRWLDELELRDLIERTGHELAVAASWGTRHT